MRRHPDEAWGRRQREREKSGQIDHSTQADSFTVDTAKKTGKPERTIRRAAKRGKDIGAETLTRIAGTSLDKGVELDALAALPLGQRAPLVERAVAGEKVSARGTGSASLVHGRQQNIPRTDREIKRVEAFLKLCGVAAAMGLGVRGLEVPALSVEEADKIVADVTETMRELKQLKNRIRAAAGGIKPVMGASSSQVRVRH